MDLFTVTPKNLPETALSAKPGREGSSLPGSFAQFLQSAGARIEGDFASLIGRINETTDPRRSEPADTSDEHGYGRDDGDDHRAERAHDADRGDERDDDNRGDRRDDHARDRDPARDENRDHGRPEDHGDHEPRHDESRDDGASAPERSNDGGQTDQESKGSRQDNQDGEQSPAASGESAGRGAEQANASHGDGHAPTATGQQHAQQVLSGLIETAQSDTRSNRSDNGGVEQAGPNAGENALHGLNTALASVGKGSGSQGNGPNHPGAHGQAHQGQANQAANTAANELAQNNTVNQAATGQNDKATQQASALSRLVGEGNRVSVQVGVTDEADALVSRPASTIAQTAASTSGGNQNQGGAQSHGFHGQAGQSAATNAASPGVTTGANPNQGQQTANESARILAAAAAGGKGAGQAGGLVHSAASNAPVLGGESGPTTVPGAGEAQQTQQSAASQASQAQRPALPSQAVVDQVTVQITKALQSGADRITIRLVPASLGRVEVQLEVAKDGHVSAIVTADNKDTLDLLQRDSKALQEALAQAGFQAGDEDLSFNLRGEGGQDEDEAAGTGPSEDDADADAADDLDAWLDADGGTGIGPDGRVNIRV